jgi:UDP-2,3-diacylglucosamine pyrophosphatase LpxH
MRDINGTLYCNDGDWVESRSALVEHMDGRLEIIFWDELLAAQTMLLHGDALSGAAA